jgi:redox-sensitive bicupin YhaK (pirin superfamily)
MTSIERVFEPRLHDIGGLTVGRVLPFMQQRMVGPFIFLDHIGPTQMAAGQALNVRPHPHIGLSTLTYLFEGKIFHRDNLGNALEIAPGAVNWMTAGRGIAHSERTASDEAASPHRIHGLQFWVALPTSHEEMAPEFTHYPAASIPVLSADNLELRIIAGAAFGAQSPVKTYSPLFYADARLRAGASITLPDAYAERALYVIAGGVEIDGEVSGPSHMVIFRPGASPSISAKTPAHFVLLGGEPFPETRHIWWNFVSSSKSRIEQAKRDWAEGRFAPIPGDADEFIPLPQ